MPRPFGTPSPLAEGVREYIRHCGSVTQEDICAVLGVTSNRVLYALMNIETNGTLLAMDGREISVYEPIPVDELY